MPTDPRVDQYIAAAPEFAKPILTYLRELVHRGCPGVEEDIKWTRPVFLHRKKILYMMAAFKAHCAFGFWHPEVEKLLVKDGIKTYESAGSIGRITNLADLPPKKTILHYIQEAQRLADQSAASPAPRKRNASPKPPLEIPSDLSASLTKNKAAAKAFEKFSPSHRREYIEWITEAKREETRQKRIATTIEWLAEGKPRNWKHMSA